MPLVQALQLPLAEANLTGRVVIVTGSNAGLGYETALHLAEFKPSRLILAVRRISAGAEAASTIEGKTGLIPEVWELDQSSLRSVTAFGEKMKLELPRRDVFVANVGVIVMGRVVTGDAFEQMLQVNNISTSLLCVLALPLLKQTAMQPIPQGGMAFKPHLSVVSSGQALTIEGLPESSAGKGPLQHLNDFQFSGMQGGHRYHETKAINILNVEKLAKLAGPSVIVVSVNPGFCDSNFGLNNAWYMKIVLRFMRWRYARTSEVGSRAIVWSAVSPDIPSGEYSDDCGIGKKSDFLKSDKAGLVSTQIWDELKEIWKSKAGFDADAYLT